MNKLVNRRSILALMAGAAALPIAAVTPNITHAETIEPMTSTKPDLSEIPGLDQFQFMHLMATVRTHDGRLAAVHMMFDGAGVVEIRHAVGDGPYLEAQLPAGVLESVPTWMQKEIGYAAMSATND